MSKISRRLNKFRAAFGRDAAPSSSKRTRKSASSASARAVIEAMESRQMLSVSVPGFSETQYAGGGGKMKWVSGMDHLPDGRILVGGQYDNRFSAGVLYVVKNGNVLPNPALKLNVSRGYERGLVGILVDPNFASNGNIFVYWTAPSTPGRSYPHNVISRFTMQGDVVNPASRVDIFHQEAVVSEFHNGGAMHWGPDGKLYVGVGDNANRATSQSLKTTKGKILRINKDGTIPSDNPFYNSTTGVNKAIWALGFRNPFTFAFQPGTGRLFANDVGLNDWEEVNEIVKGGNYGWATLEGPRQNGQSVPANYKDPIYYYHHPFTGTGEAAIAGAEFWNGNYYFADYVTKKISRMDPNTKAVSTFGANTQVLDFDVGPDGALYYLTNGPDAKIFRVASNNGQSVGITSSPVSQQVAVGANATFTVSAFGQNLNYQWQRNGVNISGANGTSYTVTNAQGSDSGDKFRAIVSNGSATATSAEAVLTVVNDNAPKPVINTPAAGTLWKAGTTLNFSGSATDTEDGVLPASAFTWSVDYYTGTTQRPLYLENSGIKSDSIAIPSTTPYTKADVFLRITLTVKDSDGITSTVIRDLQPQKALLTVKTNVAGLAFTLDSTVYKTTQSAQAVVGVQRTIGAPLTQSLNGVNYEFTGWSDGGARERTFFMPATASTYTANYKVVGGTVPPTATTKFNFQPAAAPTVSGYLVDSGNLYGARNGKTYGWNVTNTVVDRNINSNQLVDTNVSVKSGSHWELAVPNGTYTVKVGVGDAGAASTNNVWVEGKQLFNYLPLGANQFSSKSITVAVSDGRLRVAIGGAASGQVKLDYVEISAPGTSPSVPPTVPPTSPPPPTSGGTPVVSISPASVIVTEGNSGTKTVTLTVSLDRAPAGSVKVYYATSNAGAVKGSDYTAAAGSLTFIKGGMTSKTIALQVVGDTAKEGSEAFTVSLFGVEGGVLGTATAKVTIADND